MVAIHETVQERTDVVLDDEEDHDGWGPIRPRRSGMPPDLHAADTHHHEHEHDHQHDDDDEPDTMHVLCTPLPQGIPDKR